MREIEEYLDEREEMAGKALEYWDIKQKNDSRNIYLQLKEHYHRGRYEAVVDMRKVIESLLRKGHK